MERHPPLHEHLKVCPVHEPGHRWRSLSFGRPPESRNTGQPTDLVAHLREANCSMVIEYECGLRLTIDSATAQDRVAP